MNQYDVVVIGCKINSLISALSLLNENKKVLLIDSSNTIGDLLTNNRFGRYVFNMDFHHFYLKNNTFNYSLNKVLDSFKFDKRIGTVSLDNLCTIKLRDNEYVLPFGIDTFINYLDSKFEGSKKELEKLFLIAEMVRNVYESIYENKMDFSNIMKEYKEFVKVSGMSLNDGLDYLGIENELKEVLCRLCIFYGVDKTNLSFIDYLLFLINVVERGIQVPKDNSLLEMLLYEFINRKGIVRFNSNVVNLIIEDNTINGIRLDTGEVIYTTKVVINDKTKNIFGNMINPSDISRNVLKHINRREEGSKLFSIHIGLNKNIDELNIKNYINIIGDNIVVYGYDKRILSIHYLLKDNVFVESINSRNYSFTIDRMTKKIIDELQNSFNIKVYDYIEEIKVVSPFDNNDLFDYKLNVNDSFLARRLNEDNEKYVKGLYVCDGFNGDIFGYNSSLISGILCSKYFKNEGDNNE